MQTLDKATSIQFVDLKAQYESIKTEIDAAIAAVIKDTAFIGGPFVKTSKRSSPAIAAWTIVSASRMEPMRSSSLSETLGIGPGDEVITVANSFIATSEAIRMAGAQVVFVDINPETYTIDVTQIEQKITSKTKAIIPVHLYGQPADMDPLLAIARKARVARRR